MARRRKQRSRKMRTSSPFKQSKRKSSSSGYAGIVGAAGYGAIRQYASNYLSPYTSKIPAGDYADEVGMLIANWAANKYVPVPLIKQAARAGMLIEASRIGAKLASGMSISTTSNSTQW